MDSCDLHFECNKKISAELFIDLLERSGLAERRPVGSEDTIAAMLEHASLLCTAWIEGQLVGVARSLTDFAFCCYLSDLAVDLAWQHRGIGRELIRLTQAQLGPDAKIILLAAPAARNYYPKLGFTAHPSAWVLEQVNQNRVIDCGSNSAQ